MIKKPHELKPRQSTYKKKWRCDGCDLNSQPRLQVTKGLYRRPEFKSPWRTKQSSRRLSWRRPPPSCPVPPPRRPLLRLTRPPFPRHRWWRLTCPRSRLGGLTAPPLAAAVHPRPGGPHTGPLCHLTWVITFCHCKVHTHSKKNITTLRFVPVTLIDSKTTKDSTRSW